MAEEERENINQEEMTQEEKTQEEKIQASIPAIMQEIANLVAINAILPVVNFAHAIKTSIKSIEESCEQATEKSVQVCEEYRVKGEARKEIVTQTKQLYKDKLKLIDAEYAEKEEKLEEQQRQQTDGYIKEIVKLAKACGEYLRIKASPEYKDFKEITAAQKKLKESYEKSTTIPEEEVKNILDNLKAKEQKNPLAKCAEEIKNIQARLKGTYKAHEEWAKGMDELKKEAKARYAAFKEEESQALITNTEKYKDLTKPTAGQRILNFFSSTKKRAARAGEVMKGVATKTIQGVEKACNFVGTGTVKLAKNSKDFVVKRYENARENKNKFLNSLYATLKANYEVKNNRLNELRGITPEKVIPVPEEKQPAIEDDDVKIEKIEEVEKAERPGAAAQKENKRTKDDSGDREV